MLLDHLQLSTLWQGFQGVQLSMERLGDILNQTRTNTRGTLQLHYRLQRKLKIRERNLDLGRMVHTK